MKPNPTFQKGTQTITFYSIIIQHDSLALLNNVIVDKYDNK